MSIRSDTTDHRQHMPAQSSPLRAVFGPRVSTRDSSTKATGRKHSNRSNRTGESEMEQLRLTGTPFALTIPPLPPSSVRSRSRKSITPQAARSENVNDENTPLPIAKPGNRKDNKSARTPRSVKRTLAVSAGDQTIFAPSLLENGDESLLMDQHLPTYKDLWNSAEDDGEDEFGSFMMDSPQTLVVTVLDGSVRNKRGKGHSRKSVLGESTMNNTLRVVPSTANAHDKSSSQLASRYKPTPKPDTSSRRRSTLFAKIQTNNAGDAEEPWKSHGKDMLVPLYAPSSPMAIGMESTPFGMQKSVNQRVMDGTERAGTGWENVGESDTEDLHSDEELGIAEAEGPEDDRRPLGSQAVRLRIKICLLNAGLLNFSHGNKQVASQSSAAFASQSVPEVPASPQQLSATRTATPSRSPSGGKSRTDELSRTAPMPRSPVSLKVASKKRASSQRPDGGNTPTRSGSPTVASPRPSPNPRVKKAPRRSTRKSAAPRVVEMLSPSSPVVSLAVVTMKERMSMGHRMQLPSAIQPKSSGRSKRASVSSSQQPKKNPRSSSASESRLSVAEKPVSKARRLSGRKSTGGISASQVSAGSGRRARHSLPASTLPLNTPPKGKRRPRQSLAPLELVERVGLLDIPIRPASPTEDPLLLIPSARRSTGSSRQSAGSSTMMTEGRMSNSPGNETISDVRIAKDNMTRNETTNDPVMDQVAEEPRRQVEGEAGDYALASLDFVAPLSPEPRMSPRTLTAGLVQPRALGSSPWIAANLSIFSPTAMQSSPVQHSPVRWRIASPPVQPEIQASVSVPLGVDVGQRNVQEMTQSQPEAQANVEDANDGHHESEEGSSLTAVAVDESNEQEYGDGEGNYMPDSEYRNYEREDSPLSSHDGDVDARDGAEQVIAETLDTAHGSTDDPSDLQENQASGDQDNENHNVEEPPLRDEHATSTTDTQLVPLASPSHEAASLIRTPTPKKTKKIGRICIRLPLNPVIVKLEPEEEYSSEREITGPSQSDETATREHASQHEAAQVSGTESENEDPVQEQQQEPAKLPSAEQDEDDLTPSPRTSAVPHLEEEILITQAQSATYSPTPAVPDALPDVATAVPQSNEPFVERSLDSAVPSIHGASTALSPNPAATAVPIADSPFTSSNLLATASTSKPATADVAPAKQVFRESVSSVSVSSEDPRAAARAAALLKLHHRYLNEGPVNDDKSISESGPSKINSRISPSKRRISQYFHSAEEASSLTLPQLLQEAELELVDTSALNEQVPSRLVTQGLSTVYSPFPMPGSWSAIGRNINNARHPQKGRVDFSQWSIEDWKDLERCYKRVYKQKLTSRDRNKESWDLGNSAEVIDRLCKLKGMVAADLRGEWASETIRLRINTLHRKRKAENGLESDLVNTGSAQSRSPKRQKASDSSFVERSANGAAVPTSKRFMHLLSRGWRSVLQLVEPSKMPQSAERMLPQHQASANNIEQPEDLVTPSMLQEATTRVTNEMTDGLYKSRETTQRGVHVTHPAPSTPLDIARPASLTGEQLSEARRALKPQRSVLARAELLNSALKSTPTMPSIDFQPRRRTSSTSSHRPKVIADASSSRPMISLPRRSLISQEASPSVRNMIQSFEKSFEADESRSFDKDASPIVQELHRLSSRRSVSGRSSLREALERSIGGGAKSAS
ncbi:hypothetical protein QFC22_005061 [Naganishia vaughanmartiniae]|uniref:Uncharacterized protein n=1 Tax=Naganishia vaughanmartiniae TaxID=1424756 RepID=A0ACC2WWP2_9TREE|nr:hypothetical protein QFC22_005061 [Naganishia vaughanmartiniae]